MTKGKHELSVEELVARLSTEVVRLQECSAQLQASPPPQLAIPALVESEQLLRFEQLLGSMLEKARPTKWYEQLICKLFPKQISHNLLSIETLTNLFETYRLLTYECSNMKRDLNAFRKQIEEGIATEIKRDFVVFQQDNQTRITRVEELVRAFTREQDVERARLEESVREYKREQEESVCELNREQVAGTKRLEELLSAERTRLEEAIRQVTREQSDAIGTYTQEQNSERIRLSESMSKFTEAQWAERERLDQVVTVFTQKYSVEQKRLENLMHEFTDTQSAARRLTQMELVLHRSLIDRRLGSAPSAVQNANSTLENGPDEQLDSFYLEFENKFRGSREEVIRRLRVWLPLVPEALRDVEAPGILDLGCGRGEWLELLREHGHIGIGIDMNGRMIELCASLGLDVRKDDALDFLRSVPDETQSLVTGFHIIEHLPFPIRRQILREVFRALRPGGLALFETPNPANLLVGGHTFYTDYTHLQPLPPAATQFLFESLGFVKVEIREVNPVSPTERIPGVGEPLRDRFNQLFYGPRDYAVVGWKPLGAAI
jgi:SAM-dependent methyltransferase